MIREAIANYIQSKADYIKSKIENEKLCNHNWKLINESNWGKLDNPKYTWREYIYFCNKCGECKKISTEVE